MVIIYILYLIFFVITVMVGFICLKIKASGINVRDFFEFVLAINDLDNLYIYSKSNLKMNDLEQQEFMIKAEILFSKFEKVPSMIWEDEYEKYEQVLETYKNIKMLRFFEKNLGTL